MRRTPNLTTKTNGEVKGFEDKTIWPSPWGKKTF